MTLTKSHFLLRIRCFNVMLSFIQVLQLLCQKNLPTAYPNIICQYIICLTLPVTTASAEHFFSKLKLTKSILRSTIGQSCLSALLLLSIERELTDQVDFNCVIDAFASIRPQRMPLYYSLSGYIMLLQVTESTCTSVMQTK